jgi:hypothetical protein
MNPERPLDSYVRVHVPWNDSGGGVNAYLTDAVDLDLAGWVRFTADGWLWSSEVVTENRRDYFDVPQPMAIPVVRVLEIYWPTAALDHQSEGTPA